MTSLYLDIETFSETPITHGTYKYAESTEVLMVQVAIDDGPVTVWDCSDPEPRKSQMAALQNMIDKHSDEVVIHSQFERLVLPYHGVHIPIEKITDVMILGLLHSFPGGLGQLCDILEVPVDKAKDKRGKRLINLFTKPLPKNMKLRRATRETHPAEWEEFKEYAALDVVAMREVRKRLPAWNWTNQERALWHLDQQVNDWGFRCDIDLATSALRAFTEASAQLAQQTKALTGGTVGSTTQRDALREYLRAECDLDLADLTGATVEKILRGDVTREARELLENRQQAAATSPAKYRALLKSVGSDDRLRGTLQWCGAARTLRDGGRLFQPQNLPRCPDWFDSDAQEATIAAFKADAETLLYADVVDRCCYTIRGALVPDDGCDLVVADLSNIEGRIAAWLAGETWKIEAFKAFDRKEGHDLYKVAAGRILHKDPGDVTKPERQRFGKTSELAFQFGGAVGAYRKMGGLAAEAMEDDDIVEIVRGWRQTNPAIKSFWYQIGDAVRAAIENPGKKYLARVLEMQVVAGPSNDTWLRIKCPGGAYLSYRNPRIEIDGCARCSGDGEIDFEFKDQIHRLKCPECNGKGEVGSGEITYEGVDQYTRQWKHQRTFGGKVFENVVQHVARQVFMQGFRRAMAKGFKVVLRVHDELVAEVPHGSGLTLDILVECMAANDIWNIGLPLAAAGDVVPRYRKLG